MMPLSRCLSSGHLISLKTISPCMPSKRRSHTPSECRSGPNHRLRSKSVEGGIALPPFEQELIKALIELNTPIQEIIDAVQYSRRTVFKYKQKLKVLIAVFYPESQLRRTAKTVGFEASKRSRDQSQQVLALGAPSENRQLTLLKEKLYYQKETYPTARVFIALPIFH